VGLNGTSMSIGHFEQFNKWRPCIAVVATLFLFACSGGGSSSPSQAKIEEPVQASKPLNVLFIIVDDLSRQVGFLGDESASTPSMDTLAQSSIVFENAFAQAPLCNPSRVSFLTGVYPHYTGIYGLKPNFWELEEYADLLTLPQHFRKNGYHTGSVGKVLHHERHSPSFDLVEGWFGAFGPFPPEPLNLEPNSQFSKYFDWGPLLDETETADYQVASAAMEYIRSAPYGDSPFFLAVGFFRPHVPLYAPQEYFDLHPISSVQVPVTERSTIEEIGDFAKQLISYNSGQKFNTYLQDQDRARGFLQAYRASVSLTDSQVGRVLGELEESGHADETIVVMIGDHGVQNGAKNLWFKRTLWEQTAGVPMLISIPGVVPRRIDMPVGLVDLFPTLSEIAGLPAPDQLQGISLVPWIEAPDGVYGRVREPVLTVHGPGNVSIRDGRWRYIRYADGSEELYDHWQDTIESVNLVADDQDPEIQNALESLRYSIPEVFSDFAPGTEGMSSAAYPGR
jgi:choline-sulfatase